MLLFLFIFDFILFNEAVFYNTRRDREKWFLDNVGEMWGQEEEVVGDACVD
jgi:hypothetical protein